MSKLNCPVVCISKIENNPNADNLCITEVDGYPVQFKRGDFQVGSFAIYIPIDAVVPLDHPAFAFLKTPDKLHQTHYRVKAKKLRGVFSMGFLVSPHDAFPAIAPEGYPQAVWTEGGPEIEGKALRLGDDVSNLLKITKYIEPLEPWMLTGENVSDPGCIPVYTDVESYRKYKHVLQPSDQVVVTEKIHGCVSSAAKIQMSDGSFRRAKDVQEGDFIAGITDTFQLVSNKVLKKFENGLANQWVEIKTSSTGAGRGPSYRVFRVTPNHPIVIIDENGKQIGRRADLLKIGDRVCVTRTDIELSFFQQEVLKGKLLGDGSASSAGRSVVWGHSELQHDYVKWTADALGGLVHPSERTHVSGFGSKMFCRRTVSSDMVKAVTAQFLDENGKKKIPSTLSLTPVSLAYWYMDDGSLGHHADQEDRANFAVCSFSDSEVHSIQAALRSLGINSVFYKDPDSYNRLRLNAIDAEKLFVYIAPYIPPCMQYKLPERYRGGSAWYPKSTFKSPVTIQTITSIVIRNENGKRIDFTTETGNYLVSGVVVENCNGRFAFVNEEFYVGSHHRFKAESADNVWWRVASQYDLRRKLAKTPGLVLYGEVLGVQDLRYNQVGGQVDFRVFDIFDISLGHYWNHERTVAWCIENSVPHVPVLYHGPYDPATIEPLADGVSKLADHIREGIVIKTDPESWCLEIGRVILKLVGEAYLLRKGGTEHK